MMGIEAHLAEAAEQVAKTLLPGDAEKWAAYRRLGPEDRLAWRRREGHEEFCRLQRLDFHGIV